MVEKSRHRLGGISDAAWSDPYIIGFLVMLISIVARVEAGRIEGDGLCRVQSDTWEDITRMSADMMAEDVLLLSTARNPDFELGCRNATMLSSMLFGSPLLSEGGGILRPDQPRDLETDPVDSTSYGDDVSAVWAIFFDCRIPQQPDHDTSESQMSV